ncbi:DNA-binding protein [Salinisphaera hydrothermalis]|uniref:DNA-binding protein n=1 Tax=Salinisphaera hydrothermalis TaxID=563188 RepID=UPI003341BB9C
MKRMLLHEYRRHAYLGRPPSRQTLINWIRHGALAGEKIGGAWVVFVDDNGEALHSTGNALADAALSRWKDQQLTR